MPYPLFWTLALHSVISQIQYILKLYSVLALGCAIINQTLKLYRNRCHYKQCNYQA